MNFSDLPLRTKIVIGSCCPLILLVILSVFSFYSVNSLLQSSHWVDHTHSVIQQAMNIEAAAVDMETGMRGYLLAGKDEFLAPYTGGEKRFHELAAALKKTVDDNPAQVQLLNEVEATINDWEEKVTEPTIELRRQIGDAQSMNDMAKLIQQAKGKKYFDKFRGQIATFIEREEALMVQRQEKANTSQDIKELKQLTSLVTHTYEVIATAETILASAVDMETGMRGYLLAGKDEFLEPYNGGKSKFYELVASLSKTVDDNPAQVALLGEIKATITNWIEKVVEDQIALRRAIGDSKTMDDMADRVGEARGKVFFDKFRDQIETFKGREEALMNTRQEDAKSTASRTRIILVAGTLVTVLAALVISFILGLVIARPIKQLVSNLKDIAEGEGDLTTRLEVKSKDETGEMSKWFNMFLDNIQKIIKTVKSNADTLASSSTELSSISDQLASGSETTVQKANTVSAAAEEMNANMNSVASAMEQASTNVSSVAAATDEMSASIGEISKNAENAKDAASNAVSQSERASERVNELGQAAEEIGVVTETIRAISDKTDLLAMNATIEAARAGEAGKGFAVVASEIKDLAKKTAESTEDISSRLQAIQKTTGMTVTEIEQVANAINQVNELVTSIAAAVVQQNSATGEISENVGQTSLGLQEINENVSQTTEAAGQVAQEISEVNEAANEISNSSSQVQQSAAELSKLSEQLKELLNRFHV